MSAALLGAVASVDPEKVTPGIGGFLVFFGLALATWVLYRSFTTHMRRVDVRAKLRAEAQDAARELEEPDSGNGSETPRGGVR